jgi:hypothetical protein
MGTKVLRRIAGAVGPVVAGALALVVGLAKPEPVKADGASEAKEKNERCATRVSIALLGKTATPELLASDNPQSAVDAMLSDAAFIERFARFVNSQFNADPGDTAEEDSAYTLAKYVLEQKKPWKEMFVGQYNVTATVAPDPNGLGYFRSLPWMQRYAGNEPAGYRLPSAYRILQNTTGLKLTAVTNAAGVDISATGRQAAGCAGCHYQNWYALDLVAKILSHRKGTGANMTFTPPNEGPQKILGGQTIANDKELVEALVASENFKFNQCRLAFQFLYGRPENTCEATVFDKCVDAFVKDGTIQSGIAAIAKDPTFCQ